MNTGGLTDKSDDKIEDLGAKIGRAAAKMAAADRKLELSDVIKVPLHPAAGKGRSPDDSDLWFVNLTGDQVFIAPCARMLRACALWARRSSPWGAGCASRGASALPRLINARERHYRRSGRSGRRSLRQK